MNQEIAEKTERIERVLVENDLGGVLINAQHNFAWLTGGGSNGIDSSRENGACFLLVRRDGKRFLLANNIEMHRLLAEEISADEFEPVEYAWQQEKGSGDFVVERAKSLLEGKAEIASDLVLHNQIRSVENLIARCRYRLTESEVERYKKLGADAGAAVGRAIEIIHFGETETEIARKTANELAKFNIRSIVTLAGADERLDRYRHPVPTENRWKKTLVIVVCARREGLIANLSRIVCVGAVPDELRRKTEAAAHVFAKLLSATEPGRNGAELYQIAAEAYAEKGFPDEINLHHQGGATGYKTREWVIHPTSSETVFAHQAFAWNPSIAGTKTEETALLSGGEIEIITATPGFPSVSTKTGGREFLSPGILSL